MALAATALLAVGASLWVRKSESRERPVSQGLGVLVLAAGLGFVAVEWAMGVSWRAIAPLHLCDLAVFVGAAALFTRRQLPFELLYFWGLTGTLLVMLTPELAEDFPHHRFIFYFLQHGSLVVAAAFLAVGLRMRPRPRAALTAWLWLNAVAAGVGAIDLLFDVNFLYLRRKPEAATPLDWFGEWPLYLIVCEGLALGMFVLLSLPFRRASPSSSSSER